jgi:FMN phosphatase YigB (HAD superfamily)
VANKIKAVIFDWGRTLHDPETDALFDGVSEMAEELSRCYQLVLVSLAKSDSPEGRRKKIEESGIAGYFKFIIAGGGNKIEICEEALADLGLMPEEVAIVDDQVIRGIAWGNHRGATTVWVKKGKFAGELPTKETGDPTFTVSDIVELKNLLLGLF